MTMLGDTAYSYDMEAGLEDSQSKQRRRQGKWWRSLPAPPLGFRSAL